MASHASRAAATLARVAALGRPLEEHSEKSLRQWIKALPEAERMVDAMSDVDKSRIAGFLDGDGCIEASPKPSGITGKTKVSISITAAQSRNRGEPSEFEFLRSVLPGTVWERRAKTAQHRASWKWQASGRSVILATLLVMEGKAALKPRQAEIAKAFLLGNSAAAVTVLALAKSKDEYQSTEVDAARVNDAYLAGLFAAEGYIAVDKGIRVSITQRNSPELLKTIQAKFGGSIRRDEELIIWDPCASVFLARIQPMLFGAKCSQVTEAFAWKSAVAGLRQKDPKRKVLREEAITKLKCMKRE